MASVTASRHGQFPDPETEAAKWNPTITHFIKICLLCLGIFTIKGQYQLTYQGSLVGLGLLPDPQIML